MVHGTRCFLVGWEKPLAGLSHSWDTWQAGASPVPAKETTASGFCPSQSLPHSLGFLCWLKSWKHLLLPMGGAGWVEANLYLRIHPWRKRSAGQASEWLHHGPLHPVSCCLLTNNARAGQAIHRNPMCQGSLRGQAVAAKANTSRSTRAERQTASLTVSMITQTLAPFTEMHGSLLNSTWDKVICFSVVGPPAFCQAAFQPV